MHMGLWHYVVLGMLVFSIGVTGIVLNRRNLIVILMSVEIMLLAINILFVAFGKFYGHEKGDVFALCVLAIAAAEAAIGLALIVSYYRKRGSIDIEEMRRLQG